MTERIPTEHEEQRQFVSWFRQTFDARILAIPNGGKRGKAEAMRLKAEGVTPGVPDLYIPAWRTWIEFKRIKGGRIDPEQRDWHEYLRSVGDMVIVAYGCDDAKKYFTQV